MIEVIAEYKEPKTVPQRSRATVEDFEILKEIAVTKRAASSAPKKAPAFNKEINPQQNAPPPKDAAITAPRLAPEVMPMMPGSASGFLKNI